ncbi:MAG: alpha-hydroxy acid oxidase, partial [Hyphomicrobiales bacterium]
MELDHKYPSIHYLEKRARRRMPHFAWEYLASGTGAETLLERNIARLNDIELTPSMCMGDFTPNTETKLLGHTYSVPFGAAPVGMSGLMWPGSERYLAATAARRNMPYCLSMVACETPETIGPLADGNGWFQLYAPSQTEIEIDLLKRAKESGFNTLIFTVDVPVGSRRERQLRAGLTMPPKRTPLTLLQVALRPEWAFATLKHGQP